MRYIWIEPTDNDIQLRGEVVIRHDSGGIAILWENERYIYYTPDMLAELLENGTIIKDIGYYRNSHLESILN